MCQEAAVACVISENTTPFASKDSLRYNRHWNPTSTEYTSMALPLEPSGYYLPQCLIHPPKFPTPLDYNKQPKSLVPQDGHQVVNTAHISVNTTARRGGYCKTASWRGKCHKLGRSPDGQSREFLLRPQQTRNRNAGRVMPSITQLEVF